MRPRINYFARYVVLVHIFALTLAVAAVGLSPSPVAAQGAGSNTASGPQQTIIPNMAYGTCPSNYTWRADDNVTATVPGASSGTQDPMQNGYCINEAAYQAALEKACSILNWSFQTCIFVPAMSWTGSLFLGIGGGLVAVTGGLLDTLINSFILNFKYTLDTQLGILTTIEQAWGMFRDVTNIVIIGAFLFIAIALILGVKEYGDKRLIAKLLIVAILINFSLLFAKVVIDASNYTAYQIYQSSPNSSTRTGFSLDQRFLAPLGITGFWDAKSATDRAASAAGGGYGAGVRALMFGFLGGILLIFLASVLLYGALLVLGRAVLFVILMVTAPLAVASYAIPKWGQSGLGWTAWWKTLINIAVFAPLMMFGVEVTMRVLDAAKIPPTTSAANSRPGGMTVGSSLALLIDPGAAEYLDTSDAGGTEPAARNASAAQVASGGEALFGSTLNAPQSQTERGSFSVGIPLLIYLIGTAMLLLTFTFSHKVAGAIAGGGYNWKPGFGPLAAAGGAFALAGGLTGLTLRGTAGRYHYNQADKLAKEAKEAGTMSARARTSAGIHQLYGNKELAAQAKLESQRLADTAAKKAQMSLTAREKSARKYDVRSSVGAATKAATALAGGKATQSYAEKNDKQVQRTAQIASMAAPDAKEVREMQNKQMEQFKEQRETQQKMLADTHKAAQEEFRQKAQQAGIEPEKISELEKQFQSRGNIESESRLRERNVTIEGAKEAAQRSAVQVSGLEKLESRGADITANLNQEQQNPAAHRLESRGAEIASQLNNKQQSPPVHRLESRGVNITANLNQEQQNPAAHRLESRGAEITSHLNQEQKRTATHQQVQEAGERLRSAAKAHDDHVRESQSLIPTLEKTIEQGMRDGVDQITTSAAVINRGGTSTTFGALPGDHREAEAARKLMPSMRLKTMFSKNNSPGGNGGA